MKASDMEDLPIDATAHVKSLMDLTECLSEIFAEENGLIAEGRMADAAHLQPEKERLAAAYAHVVKSLAEDRAIVSGADASLLSELRSVTATFEARAARQHALLETIGRAAAATDDEIGAAESA